MSSASYDGAGSRRTLAIVLAVLGVIAIIVGVLWFAGAAPHFLNIGSHVKGHGGHVFRGAAGVVVGLVLLVFAWIQNKKAR